MAPGRVQMRIDPLIQEKAEAILELQGIKPSQAITMLYHEICRGKGMPFSPRPLDDREEKILREHVQKQIEETHEDDMVSFKNADDMLDSLHTA